MHYKGKEIWNGLSYESLPSAAVDNIRNMTHINPSHNHILYLGLAKLDIKQLLESSPSYVMICYVAEELYIIFYVIIRVKWR